MKSIKPLPPLEVVRAVINYNSETGEFTYVEAKQGRCERKRKGSKSHSYKRLTIAGKKYVAHRLAWLLHYGEDPDEMVVDHINGDRRDNRISNLRLATQQQNTWNTQSEGLGVTKRVNKWVAYIRKQGKVVRVSTDCPLLTHIKIVELRSEIHGEYAAV